MLKSTPALAASVVQSIGSFAVTTKVMLLIDEVAAPAAIASKGAAVSIGTLIEEPTDVGLPAMSVTDPGAIEIVAVPVKFAAGVNVAE